MKITIEHYDEKFTIETENDDLTLTKLHDIWERCLMAMTFNQEAINEFYDNTRR